MTTESDSQVDNHYINGDLFDNDNGDYYARITEGAGDELKAPPANLTLYFNGFWYNYKMDSREEHQHSEKDIPVTNEEIKEIINEKKDKYADL